MALSPNLKNKKKVRGVSRLKARLASSHAAAIHGRKLLRFLKRRKDFLSPLLIMTHNYPDPDAIAAAVTLQYLAERLHGIKSRIVYKGIVGRMENRAMVNLLKVPIHKFRLSDIQSYENAALIDTQPEFENNPYPRNKKVALVIDQHPYVKRPTCGAVLAS